MNNYSSIKATRQYALAYAIYEIVGSEFSGCAFKNKHEETKLKLNFLMERKNSQYSLEEKVITDFAKLNIDLSDLRCEVEGYLDATSGVYHLYFKAYLIDIYVMIDRYGHYRVHIEYLE